MLPEREKKDPVHVVDLGSSEDEDGSTVQNRRRKSVSQSLHLRTHITGSRSIPPLMDSSNESRCFWRAGDYDVVPSKSAPPQGQLEHARVHPKFLHSNATSHKWAFGAIAELLDNAVDEVRNGATFVKVDKIYNMKDNSPALLFQDNGGGMNPECLRLCMSLGYSSKKANTTIGQYGNGFKTSTMRLGADVIVFSRANHGSRATQSVGLLSYTFLRRTGQDDVIVPMVDFELTGHQTQPIIYSSEDDWSNNLKLILEWSPFPSKDELMRQFDDIGVHGTKVIIYNLWLNDEGVLELDFYNDEKDIRLRDEVNSGKSSKIRESDRLLQSHVSYLMRYSLRAYASILYLRKFTNFNIIIRGKPVKQLNFAAELKSPSVVTYKPQLGMTSKEVSVKITIGFVKEAPNLGVYGFNVYHKNRLIRPFWRVNHEGSSRGKGVVGVLEANFIEPAHDKQDFERSALFLRLETKLKQIVNEYWINNCHVIGLDSLNPEIRNRQKDCLANLQEEGHLYQPVIGISANLQQGLGNTPSIIGLAANSQKETTVQSRPVIGLAANLQQGLGNTPSIIGLAANSQKEPTVQSRPVIGLAANLPQGLGNSSIIGLAANIQKESTVQPIIGLAAGSFTGVASSGGYNTTLLDKICEENIQLFTKCEGHRQKEINLKQTIEELEKELEETRRKCSKLSSDLEHRRNQKTMKQLSEKA